MSQATIDGILADIDRLSEAERLELKRRLAERAEAEWKQVQDEMAREADRRGITVDDIDRAVERVRYGR